MTNKHPKARAASWLEALADQQGVMAGYPASVLVADGWLGDERARYVAVVPDPDSLFPRARNGEVGLIEGWALARAVREVIRLDSSQPKKRPIVAIVDTPSQAYGQREEAYGIHQSLASAVAAYAEARLAGHSVIGLIVGRAMSGAFLAHGYQANRLIALDDPGVMIHAMSKAAAARVTMRTVEQLDALAQRIVPMAYDIGSYARLGLLWRLVKVSRPDQPSSEDVALIKQCLLAALADIRQDPNRDLSSRLVPDEAVMRQLSSKVRQHLRAAWR
ncbi:MAG: biotin-independent malonate decarboxylase subunit gamma [Lautropia sp.]|nr:biotin-independent malonate decarboxylase subunit gamma [Lautropia sp.]